jgi:hypothetical protein
LDDSEILELYYNEPRLAVLMDFNIILLVDQHLVVNLKKFITPKTHKLTTYAKLHQPACCIGVQYVSSVKSCKHKSNVITCTLDMLIQSADFLESGKSVEQKQSNDEQISESSKIDSEIDRINRILNELPGGFAESLKYHMDKKGYTEELLAQESWVSLSTIKQYRQKEDKEKTFRTVTKLCIGMHLHPWFTEDLLRKAGIIPKATKQDGAYRYLYTLHYKDSISDCNIYLKSQNLPEFKIKEKSA